MSATGQVQTFSDLYTDLMNRMRNDTTNSDLKTIAKRMINTALHDIYISDEFEWGKRWGIIITHPSYSTGTVTVSKGSTSVTGSGTSWATANEFGANNARAGGKIKLGGEVYRVASVGSDTALTLESKFARDDISGGSYLYFEDEYAPAADFDRIIMSQKMVGDIEIPVVANDKFFRAFVRNDHLGQPKWATVIDRAFDADATRLQRIVFSPSPNDSYTVRYRYATTYLAVDASGAEQTQLSADTDEPIVPLKYRHAIVLHALSMGYMTRKDDQRSQEVKQEYAQLLQRIKIETGAADPQPRIAVRRPSIIYWRGRRSRRYATGDEFEELRI